MQITYNALAFLSRLESNSDSVPAQLTQLGYAVMHIPDARITEDEERLIVPGIASMSPLQTRQTTGFSVTVYSAEWIAVHEGEAVNVYYLSANQRHMEVVVPARDVRDILLRYLRYGITEQIESISVITLDDAGNFHVHANR